MHREPTIAELRADSERTRAALAHSVDELRSQIGATAGEVKTMISPSHIKDEVKTYVRDTGASFAESLSERARENPLQALAAGAAVAVPLMKIFRSVPLPLVLIGAGFWLSSKSGRETMGVAQDRLGEALDSAREQASDMMASARDTTAKLKDDAVERLGGAASSVAETAQPMVDRSRAAMHDLRDAATGLVAGAEEKTASAAYAAHGADRTGSMAEGVSAKASQVAEGVIHAGERSRETVADFVQKNPLLTAAIGLAAGAVLASAFPASRLERKALGGVRRAGRDAVSQGIDKAMEATDEAMNSVAAAAEREGLDAEGLGNTVRDFTDKAKTVAEKGLQSASGASAKANGEAR